MQTTSYLSASKQYPAKVEQYADNLLLVGINYDKKTKQHACRIECV